MYIIDTVKLQKYVESGDILEFQSDQECLEYFNAYDFKNFQSVNEMKAYQGKYGFNIENSRYHINVDSALDVYTEVESINMDNRINFTVEELQLLYAACMSYGDKLSEIVKSIPNESFAINGLGHMHGLADRAKDSWNLARKITGYMEE